MIVAKRIRPGIRVVLQSPRPSIAEDLERLLDQGAITREEYEELKKKILGVKVDR